MCTLAWRQQKGQLWVCFNRDEQRHRPVAEAPQLRSVGGIPCIFARDPEGGGTWFAASSKGFVIALLNNYTANEEAYSKGRFSRGKLVLELCGAASIDSAIDCMDGFPPGLYAPFFLFLISNTKTRAWSWDGESLNTLDPEQSYWTSSSYKPVEVDAHRRKALRTLTAVPTTRNAVAQGLRQFDSEMPTHGITMDRESTRTVSQIELTMDSSGIQFIYHQRDPVGTGFLQPLEVNWPNP
jgi:hypothetical protein